VTRHIQSMLKVSQDLAFWAENGTWHPLAYIDDALREAAEKLGPEQALAYAAVLAQHASAELNVEQFQVKGWPAV
jgi:molybdopterin-guanine dinucleotide biosynthesis protein A